MEHNTAAITLPSLADLFADIPDQRKPKGRRYPLPPLLILLSVFCQRDTPAAITDWVCHRSAFFREQLALSWKRMPSASTWQRLLGQRIPAALLDEKVRAYSQALSAADKGLYNLDGKVLCGMVTGATAEQLHLLALHEAASNAVVEQTELLPGEHEISAAKRLVAQAPVSNKLISGDAIFAQQELSRRIVEKGDEYLEVARQSRRPVSGGGGAFCRWDRSLSRPGL